MTISTELSSTGAALVNLCDFICLSEGPTSAHSSL